MKINFIRLLILLIAFSAVTAVDASERQSCHLCGMYIDHYQHTATLLTDINGQETATCGVADMIRFIEDSGGPDAFTSIQVVAWDSSQKIDASSAVYVIGSDLVPDMVPNIIAFSTKEAAEQFIDEHGGSIMNFTQALLSISPMGMTMPTRINQAVTPPRGALGVGVGYMYMNMDDLMIDSDSVSFAEYRTRTGNTMGPKEMTSKGPMFMLSYGISDKLATSIKTGYQEKEMVMQMFMMGNTTNKTTKSSGMTDTDINLRYNLWRDTYYSKFFSLMGGLTLPTGDYDENLRTMPGLQLGIDTVGYYGGVLASARYGNFWFHTEASYTIKPENNDDYDFGDVAKIGIAAHYTPNPNFMIGLETDYTDTDKNSYNGVDVDNSGGKKAILAIISSWRFLTAFGGNLNLKVTAGVPYYEDVNAYGLGGNYFVNAMLSFKRRIHH
jgi:nitrous oxide reductase accessory protein NosL